VERLSSVTRMSGWDGRARYRFRFPAAAEMAEFGAKRRLVIERFNRVWAKDGRLLRIPQEDCCQALSMPPATDGHAKTSASVFRRVAGSG
jgi:hypothetical protein